LENAKEEGRDSLHHREDGEMSSLEQGNVEQAKDTDGISQRESPGKTHAERITWENTNRSLDLRESWWNRGIAPVGGAIDRWIPQQ
jgi:hypothetical protein